jgi:hypothetical protein
MKLTDIVYIIFMVCWPKKFPSEIPIFLGWFVKDQQPKNSSMMFKN